MEKLFSPIQIGNLELKNRFIMAPMENGMAELGTGNVTDRIIAFFEERAKKGVSMIMPGSIGVSPEGRGLPTQLSLYEPEHVLQHKRLVDAVHAQGAKIGAQLYHAGRQASEAITGLDPLAPSAIPCAILSNHPKEITVEQMQEIKEKFVRAARWSLEAGYDLIEVHFAHGYLLHSFMSLHTNKRTDEYGGSFENRIKYPMDVLKAVIREVNGAVPVQIRVSVDEYVEDGMHFDEVKKVCRLAEEAGVQSISLSAGCYDAVEYAIQPMFVPQGFIVPFAQELKQEVNVPILVAARLNDAKLIKEIIDEDKADIVAIGRGLIADPDLIMKIKNKEEDSIRYCIGCNQGCIDRVLGGMPAHCMVNPVAGEEQDRALKPKTEDKKVAVIGGGPAGMQASISLAQRGYDVVLYAKQGLDGKFSAVATPPEKESFLIFREYLRNCIQKLNIQVVEQEVKTSSDIPDDIHDVILAAGSRQILPPIQGINLSNVWLAENILKEKETVSGPVVVIGGGLVGTEVCKYLGHAGIEVTLVEMKDSIAEGIGATFIGHMFEKLNEYGVKIMTGATVNEITEDHVLVDGNKIPCKNVIIAAGYRSENELESILAEKFNVVAIGDAKSPRRILDAIEEAYLAANEL